ncbi:MAG: alpha/beta hydrolase [Nanoarchaeota archaeon]
MKGFLKRLHKKKIKGIRLLIPFLVVFGLLLLVIWLFLGIHISFAIKEELIIFINPMHTTKTVANNESFSMSYTVGTDNFWQCRSVCTANFTDLSKNQLLFSEELSLSHDAEFVKSFAFSLAEQGEGQKVYRFRAQCRNEKTLFCPTDGKPREAIATLTLNYELTPEEKELKARVIPLLTGFFQEIADSTAALEQAEHANVMLPKSPEKDEMGTRISSIGQELEKYLDLQSAIIGSWSNETYDKVDGLLSTAPLNSLAALMPAIEDIQKEQQLLIGLRNIDVYFLQDVERNSPLILSATDFYAKENNRNNQNYLTAMGKALLTLYSGYVKIDKNQSVSVTGLHQELVIAHENLAKSLEHFSTTEDAGMITSQYGRMLLVLAKNTTYSPKEICAGLANITGILRDENQRVQNLTNQTDTSSGLSLAAALLVAEKQNMTVQEILVILKITPANVSWNMTDVLFTLDPFEDFMKESCRDPDYGRSIGINLSFIDDLKAGTLHNLTIPEDTTRIEPVLLPENKPRCCLWGDCEACSAQGKTPLLFIHGHLFNEGSVPESSAEIFVPFQNALDNNFTNFGEVYLASPDVFDWQRMTNPVSVRSSYYYISYLAVGEYRISAQKGESIENYAIRLKDIIDTLKSRTGSSRVHVVAHSMGGLVVRQYADLFGWDSLDKVILIGTPNHGISKNARKVCATFGSGKECDEMLAGSIFLSRLNSKSLPPGANVTVIRGEGCNTDGEDGDGIVSGTSAYLERADNYVIKGECQNRLGTSLHSDLLNPALYPETLMQVKKLLSVD